MANAKAKTPQDHRPKNAPRKVTVQGVTITVDPEALNDFIVLDLLSRLQEDEDPLTVPKLFRRVAGDDGFRAAMTALADPDTGRVSPEAAASFFAELMAEVSPNS